MTFAFVLSYYLGFFLIMIVLSIIGIVGAKKYSWIWIAIGAVTTALAISGSFAQRSLWMVYMILLAFFTALYGYRRNCKKEKGAKDKASFGKDTLQNAETDIFLQGNDKSTSSESNQLSSTKKVPLVSQIKTRITLTNIRTGKVTTGEFNRNILRAGRGETLLLEDDPGISKTHMDFILDHGILYVQDANSRNGTRLNGIPVSSAVPVSQNDIIHAGDSDFRVNWIVQ